MGIRFEIISNILLLVASSLSNVLKNVESYFEAQNHNAYHKLLEENRKLYNQVQDLKGNVRISIYPLLISFY